ncbi:MAG: GspE/PulE family protein [Deltaproteobacteria bacterium]|nr:GspE/PulE family protein [Deltaproteobacteria bacterium]
MAQTPKRVIEKDQHVEHLKSEVEYRTRLQEIGNKIYAAASLDEILINLKDEITEFFGAERLTVFVVDGKKRELVSRFKSGDEIGEIRIPVSAKSIAGYVAFHQKMINIKDVYSEKELAGIDPELEFDKSWDQKTGFITRQVLAYPIIFKKYILGVLQMINQKSGGVFTGNDEQSAEKLSEILGIALFNQKRMAKGRTSKFDYLLENHILTEKELQKSIEVARQRKIPIENILMDELKLSKKQIVKSLGEFYEVPYIEFSQNTPIPGELMAGLKVPFMKKNVWVPLKSEDGKIIIAIDNPHDLQKIDELKPLFSGRAVNLVVALPQDIQKFIKLFSHEEEEIAEIDDILSQLQAESDYIEEAESAIAEEDSAVVQLVNKIILDAYLRGASDIHIEPYPGKENTQVRIRIDGSCAVYQTIPFSYKNAVVSRIKIMSDLDIAERRRPQDGKIKFKKYGGKDIELRVATVPTQGRIEDVVMRILPSGDPLPLDQIGFSKPNYDNFVSTIEKPYGLIFVCGPTGSGKTTTLHSAMSFINKVDTKIWTAEDPVEITQKGLRQVQIRAEIGFDFAAAMRSFLRADPDVIMVGEMRDKETTRIGIEASLTGHLVLSTLHTNSATESITRLLDMGMDPFNFADAILSILAQRLVRTLCTDCKKAYNPSEREYEDLVREYGKDEFMNKVSTPYSKNMVLFKSEGCSTCNDTGYKGRMGIHELLMGTDEMKALIQNSARMEELRRKAEEDGMATLKQDGIEKIFQGHCDLLHVRKVCIR